MSFSDEVELSSDMIKQNLCDQEDEIVALESIYPELFFTEKETTTGDSREELEIDIPASERVGKCMNLLIKVNLGTSGVQLVVSQKAAENEYPENPGDTAFESLNDMGDNAAPGPATYDIQFLPELRLRWRCPPEYPSHAAPSYTLSCSWLGPSVLTAACAELDRIAESSIGARPRPKKYQDAP